MAQWNNSRKVKERIFIVGLLHLDTPTHFGGGEAEGSTDMPLLFDAKEGRKPLLTGASIAGALRNYLREYEKGYGWSENVEAKKKSWAEELFGHLDESQLHPQDRQRPLRASVHSWLMIDDALGEAPDKGDPIELRDGVAIDPKTRTAKEKEKFDLELLSAGTTFPISFELWLSEENPQLLEALAIALHGLEKGRIGLGKRKRRGYGRCHVSGWQVWRYQMNNVEQVLGWLDHTTPETPAYQPDICTLLNVKPSIDRHQGQMFQIQATFALDGSLFIRSYGSEKSDPDAVHLRTWRNGAEKPALPGTSLAGALRARAGRIARTLDQNGQADDLVTSLFGGESKDETGNEVLVASRLWVDETILEPETVVMNLVQNRVSIDRFTGGARDTALFNEQPIWGKPETDLVIDLRLIMPAETNEKKQAEAERIFNAQVGLLLLLLKDLWTGDLPLGGESSVGRGRLKGKEAILTLGKTTWQIEDNKGSLQFSGNGSQNDLQEKYLKAFLQEVGHG